MEKNRYYVSVQSRKIMTNQDEATYELEIDATPDEVERIHELFNKMSNADFSAYWRTHIPAVPYHYDHENHEYDAFMKNVYQELYELGTPQTRDHIQSMGILD